MNVNVCPFFEGTGQGVAGKYTNVTRRFFQYVPLRSERKGVVEELVFPGGHSDVGDPSLTEGDVFKDVLELDAKLLNAVVDGNSTKKESKELVTDDAINDAINDAIKSRPGVKKVDLVKIIGKSKPTIERAIAVLKQQGCIEYRGSKKTGGYYCASS